MHRKWKAFHNPRDYDEFSLLRKRQLRIQKQCFTSFTNRTETLIKNSLEHFWRYVKSKRGGSNYPQNFTLDSESFDDGQQICLAFSNYFQKAFSAPRVSSTNMHHVLSGGCTDRGPRAACGPPVEYWWPADSKNNTLVHSKILNSIPELNQKKYVRKVI
ncbi:hypothetical protein ACJJTC_004417 [Scirpophaga incertulas]